MDSYLWSKAPMKLVLTLLLTALLNFGLVLGLQLLLNYRVSGPVDPAALESLDPAYAGCTILDHTHNDADRSSDIHVYLIQAADGTEQLVTLRKHILFDRYRIVKKACQTLTGEETSVSLRAGTYSFGVDIFHNMASGHRDLNWSGYSMGQSGRDRFRSIMNLSVIGLCILELSVWSLVFRKEEIA